MKIKRSSGSTILEFEGEVGDYKKTFAIDSKYTEISGNASASVKSGGTKALLIPASIKLIGTRAFENWTLLETILDASGVETYGVYCFLNCSHLEALQTSNATKAIYKEAFSGCRRLKTIYLRKSIHYIGKGAFSKLSPLAKIYCEHPCKPSGFQEGWTDVPSKNIIWGYKMAKEETKSQPKVSAPNAPTALTPKAPATRPSNNKYCYPCKKSYSPEYQYCPICRSELISETEYKNRLEKDRIKAASESKDKRENDILVNNAKRLYGYLSKYEDLDIYTAITEALPVRESSIADIRYAFRKCYNGNSYYFDRNYNREGLFKLYDILVEHKSFKPTDAIDELKKAEASVKERLAKLNAKLKQCVYINNNETVNYGKLASGYLSGGYFEITAKCYEKVEKRNSGRDDFFGDTIYDVYKESSYDIDKYYAPRSLSSRVSAEMRSTSSDYGLTYILMMYEMKLIQKYLSLEIANIEHYLVSKNRAQIQYPEFVNIDNLVSLLVKEKAISKTGSRITKNTIKTSRSY